LTVPDFFNQEIIMRQTFKFFSRPLLSTGEWTYRGQTNATAVAAQRELETYQRAYNGYEWRMEPSITEVVMARVDRIFDNASRAA
jgi:hypothetical protein